ncbi:MAG: hypothetical protein LBT90_03620 [Holosporaceae bacterium]|nr:hypothetical protein [Holosporaceae bacterium]
MIASLHEVTSMSINDGKYIKIFQSCLHRVILRCSLQLKYLLSFEDLMRRSVEFAWMNRFETSAHNFRKEKFCNCHIIPDLVANYPKHALHSLQIKDVIWIPDMGSGIIPNLITNFSQQAVSSLMFRLCGKAFG